KYLLKTWQKNGGAKTNSDTEVLLYLLIEYGTQCLDWLSGFFAFAFYDQENNELLLARDRFGKKPLLCYQQEDHFAFASEMKALLAFDIPRKLDHTVLHQYLQLNYIPQPQSMIQGVWKIKPGHFLRIKNNQIQKEEPYYSIQIQKQNYGYLDYEAAKKELIKKMDAAVQERMIADVPLGAFLSGGIDSSIIVG